MKINLENLAVLRCAATASDEGQFQEKYELKTLSGMDGKTFATDGHIMAMVTAPLNGLTEDVCLDVTPSDKHPNYESVLAIMSKPPLHKVSLQTRYLSSTVAALRDFFRHDRSLGISPCVNIDFYGPETQMVIKGKNVKGQEITILIMPVKP